MSTIVKDILSGKEPRKRKLDPKIIRVDDRVKIINPEIVIRIGYPMSFDEACEEVDKLYRNEIIEFLNKTIYQQKDVPLYKLTLASYINEKEYIKSQTYKKIIKALAYEHMQQKEFGGREKKIYTKVRQELLGITSTVRNISIKKTGIYFAPSGGYDSYSGEYDFEPGGLDKEKTHKILELDYWLSNGVMSLNWEADYIKIESCNVEKIHERDSEEYDY